jgi:asparagine synthase (glutamine-hydrolysing)
LELRQELLRLGHYFHTQTDTEVILAAYRQWGTSCLQHFNGMWALVIYDSIGKQLFGSRDRFGVKPLYYFRNANFFALASEIKALHTFPFLSKTLNTGMLFDYLDMGFEDHGPETLFKDIMELPPAHSFILNLQNGTFSLQKYYQLEYTSAIESFSETRFKGFRSDLHKLLYNAVKLRLRSDVAIGSCLSGGIDSSAIVCIINQILTGAPIPEVGERQKVFTACYAKKEIDESAFARIVVDKTGAAWHRVFPEAEELLTDLEDMVYHQDLPFGSTSIYAQYRVMRLAQENGIKVLLDGQGGDELFGGYTLYYPPFFYELLAHRQWRDLLSNWQGLGNSPVSIRHITGRLAKTIVKRFAPLSLKTMIRKNKTEQKELLNKEFSRRYFHRFMQAGEQEYFSLNQMLHGFMTDSHLKLLLRYEDRNSMRFSIESRTPFADDKELIAYLFKIPSTYKIHLGWSKYLLRQTLSAILPEEISRRRDKIGFATPEMEWLQKIKNDLRSYISPAYSDFINNKILAEKWDNLFANLPKSGFSKLWRVINFLVWAKVYRI